MSEALETLEKAGYTARLCQDEDPMSPKEWNTFGTLVTWHRNYTFQEDGAKTFGKSASFLETAKREDYVYIPVSMIDHSGISLYEGTGTHACDPGGWDSGQVGFMYVTKEKARKEYGRQYMKKSLSMLRCELKTWNQYVTGDVYCYAIEDAGGEVIDSCGGFYGFEDAKAEMREALKSATETVTAKALPYVTFAEIA